jgi:outer membrane protein assembly factor BamB
VSPPFDPPGVLAACGALALSGCLSSGSTATFGSHDWPMAKYAADGTERWRFEARGRVSTSTVGDGSVCVAGAETLYALEAPR